MEATNLKFEISKIGLYVTILFFILGNLWFMTSIILGAGGSGILGLVAFIVGLLFLATSWFSSKYFKRLSKLKPGEGMPPLIELA